MLRKFKQIKKQYIKQGYPEYKAEELAREELVAWVLPYFYSLLVKALLSSTLTKEHTMITCPNCGSTSPDEMVHCDICLTILNDEAIGNA